MMKLFLVMVTPLLLLASCQRDSNKGAPDAATQPAKSSPDATVPGTLIGLPLKEAEDLADKAKIPHRVISIDGQSRPMTMDYRTDRLNFSVVKGVVTGVKKG